MLFSFVFRLLVIIILLKSIISNLNTYRMLNNPTFTFNYSYIHKIVFIVFSVLFLIYTIYFFINKTPTLIVVMDAILFIIADFYLLFLSLIENRITDKGISLTLFGVYLWNDIDKVEFDNKYMILYYKVKISITKPISRIKVKLSKEKNEEIIKEIEIKLNKK